MDINEFETETEHVKDYFRELFPTVSGTDWTTWTIEDALALRNFLNTGNVVFERLRRPFDQTLYHGEGTIPAAVLAKVEPIRAKGDYSTKPGRKALTPEEILAKALA